MFLDFENTKDSSCWLELFSKMTNPTPSSPKKTKSSCSRKSPGTPKSMTLPDYRYFVGAGDEASNNGFTGRIQHIAPQQGIPGWKRMSMMKYFGDMDKEFNPENLWAYEGCVLPGGSMILGRWWFPSATMADGTAYSGPFIFWRVDHHEVFESQVAIARNFFRGLSG